MVKEKAKILVVDDEISNIKLLEAILISQNYSVITATNGTETMRIVTEDHIDLLLLDVMMPGMDGFEVTEKLRSNEKTRLIPIVLITALTDKQSKIRGIEAGCDDFISKPFDKNEVLARIKSLLKISYYRSLLDEKEKFEYVINHIDDGIVILDKSFHITHINQKAKQWLSIDKNSQTDNFITHITQKFQVSDREKFRSELLQKTLSFDIEREETETSKPLILSVDTSIVKNPLGDLSSIVLTFHDVTEKRKEEFMKEDFLSLISHKLCTPVTVIDMSANMLREGFYGTLNDKQDESVDIILKKSNELQSLVTKLLTFITVNKQSIEVSKENIALKEHLQKVVDSLIKSYQSQTIEVNVDVPEEDIMIYIDSLHFELIIQNLIENAIKFNDKDIVTIDIVIKKKPEGLEFSIHDNGMGIPPEEREKIFDKFYQSEKYFTGNVEGVGLGLALVKRLVTTYGGEIKVESQIWKGSTFIIRFPE